MAEDESPEVPSVSEQVACLVECGCETVNVVRFATSVGPEDTRPQLLCLEFDCLA